MSPYTWKYIATIIAYRGIGKEFLVVLIFGGPKYYCTAIQKGSYYIVITVRNDFLLLAAFYVDL